MRRRFFICFDGFMRVYRLGRRPARRSRAEKRGGKARPNRGTHLRAAAFFATCPPAAGRGRSPPEPALIQAQSKNASSRRCRTNPAPKNTAYTPVIFILPASMPDCPLTMSFITKFVSSFISDFFSTMLHSPFWIKATHSEYPFAFISPSMLVCC